MPDPNLAQRAEGLTTAVGELSTAVSQLAAKYNRMKHVIWWTVVGLVVDLVLTVVVGIIIQNQHHVYDQITQANSRIETVQRRTSDEVLCPLYKVLLAFENRSTTSPTLTDAERKARTEAYDVVRRGYAVLGCE